VWNWPPGRARQIAFAITLLLWCAIYGTRAFQGHLALRTNAYDLSVFDYALWSTGRIGLGYVPFIGQSLFSQHVMPTLLLLWPAYQIVPSPMLLLGIQLAAFAGAAVLLYRLLPADLPALPALALVVAFLFGRRSHSAVNSVFYIESLEPFLIFAMLLAWRSGRTTIAAAAGAIALGCKEDMALYLAAFGAIVFVQQSKRAGAAIVAVSLLWLLIVLTILIPASRRQDGLPAANPFVAASLGSPEAVHQSLERFSARRAVETLGVVTASAGLLCWLAPELLLIAVPGLLATLAFNPHSAGGGLVGHYLFPVLPWVFAAAALGAARLYRARPRVLTAVSLVLLLATVGDSPLWRRMSSVSEEDRARAALIRSALQRVPADAAVLAMPNLVPHLAHRDQISTLGGPPAREPAAWVVISATGDLWPLDSDKVRKEIETYASDKRFETVMSGPLYAFRRVQP
jgi:uncharacterized membrane protein